MSVNLQSSDWQKANDDYLFAALAWLRLCLRRQAQSPCTEAESSRCSGWGRLFRRPSGEHGSAAEVERAANTMEQAAQVNPPPALISLRDKLGLSPFEERTLLLCAAIEFDSAIAALCAEAVHDPHCTYPTFSLALALWGKEAEDAGWHALSPERPLRKWRLIEINQSGSRPLTTSPLRADERIVNYLKGINYPDDRLTSLLIPFDVGATAPEKFPASQTDAANAIIHHLNLAARDGRAPILQLVGPDRLSKQSVAQHALDKFNQLRAPDEREKLMRLPVELLPAQAAELETVARLWQRERLLLPLILYLDAFEEPGATAGEGPWSALRRLLAYDLGPVLLDTREVQPGLGAYSVPIDVGKPRPDEQQRAWSEALEPLGSNAAGTAAQLAAQFNLALPTIQRVARSVTADLSQGKDLLGEAVWKACMAETRPRLDKLAQRLEPKARWEDLVLPEEPKELLRQIEVQVRWRSKVYGEWEFGEKMNRGLGITALFSGESGTGKTMAAEVIAHRLGLNLYRIDLSAVVSKYIGETEKNLRQVFDAAEDGGAILFFDEADALFGKRSEVKDSHDRYANIEINYLLQRMEAYRGLAILATNMKSALDQAFIRRLRFIVLFPFPDEACRRQIWEKVFPVLSKPKEPLVEWLDYAFLARLPLTGGSIHNTALNAAFLAADAGTPVTMPLVLQAAQGELRKLERPFSQALFSPPPAVEKRKATWRKLVPESRQKETTFDYDRLAWWDLSDEAIARTVQRADALARETGAPVTMSLLAAVARMQSQPEPESLSPAYSTEEALSRTG